MEIGVGEVLRDLPEVLMIAAVDDIQLSARVADNDMIRDVERYRWYFSERVLVLSYLRFSGESWGEVAEPPDDTSGFHGGEWD